MKITVPILLTPKGSKRTPEVIDAPNICPHCGKSMHPELIEAFNVDVYADMLDIVTLYRCTADNCNKYFALQYKREFSNEPFVNPIKYTYRPPINVTLPSNIEKVSEMFVEIYNQSVQAERDQLLHIAGVGYRKAAEFLIKDYVIAKNPDKESNIKNMFLSNVISTYLTDFPKIQNLAKAVSWIGNDETHYVRKHDDRDIQDLKKFILATAQFIAADYDADDALDFTSSESPSAS